jgi:ABC-type amino acid transport substrate-binding protein
MRPRFISTRNTALLGLIFGFAAPTFSKEQSAGTVLKDLDVMVEDAAPPWSGADGKGYANDVVIAAFDEMGIDVHLMVVPYARCKKTVLKGQIAACFSMSWRKEFEGLVKFAASPLIFLHADVFENVKDPLPKPAQGSCSLPPDTRVATVLAYEYPPEITALQARGAKFETYLSDTHILKMLASGRTDAAIIMTNDLEPRNKKAIDAKVDDQVRIAFNCGQEVGTIGFSLKHPDGPLALKLFDDGYQRLKKKGALKAIATKWGDGVAKR